MITKIDVESLLGQEASPKSQSDDDQANDGID